MKTHKVFHVNCLPEALPKHDLRNGTPDSFGVQLPLESSCFTAAVPKYSPTDLVPVRIFVLERKARSVLAFRWSTCGRFIPRRVSPESALILLFPSPLEMSIFPTRCDLSDRPREAAQHSRRRTRTWLAVEALHSLCTAVETWQALPSYRLAAP